MHVKAKSCNRSSHLRCSMKKGVLRRSATLLKKRLWCRCFPVNLVKFLRVPFLQNTSERLLLLQQSWRPATLLKRDFNTGVFLWIFQNFWNSFFYWTKKIVVAFELCFSIRKNFQQRRLVESLFNVKIQVSASMSTSMKASAFLAKSAEFFYDKISETKGRWRPKHLSG